MSEIAKRRGGKKREITLMVKLNLNKAQLKQLAQVNGNLGILFYGSVIAQALPGVDYINPRVVALGVLIGSSFVVYSLILLKGVKDNEY